MDLAAVNDGRPYLLLKRACSTCKQNMGTGHACQCDCATQTSAFTSEPQPHCVQAHHAQAQHACAPVYTRTHTHLSLCAMLNMHVHLYTHIHTPVALLLAPLAPAPPWWRPLPVALFLLLLHLLLLHGGLLLLLLLLLLCLSSMPLAVGCRVGGGGAPGVAGAGRDKGVARGVAHRAAGVEGEPCKQQASRRVKACAS